MPTIFYYLKQEFEACNIGYQQEKDVALPNEEDR
jgi:hypothetical protein